MILLVDVINWTASHYLKIFEWLATITGFLYIYYTIREDTRLWLYGIISSALFAWVFFKTSIYANSLLYIYYVIIGFYGWYTWSRSEKEDSKKTKLKIKRTAVKKLSAYIAVSFVFAIPVYFILKNYSDSDAPMIDAVLTTGGMLATWMLTQKLIEQWILWIVIDVIWCGLMIYKGMYPSLVLFAAYTILAFKGYFEWKKELAKLVVN
jgi:nicotinamide mononucleotide transporter